MATISPVPKLQFSDQNGAPLAGGLVYTYEAGTTNLRTTYTTAAETTPRWRTHGVVLEPLCGTAIEGESLGLSARQSAIELGYAGALAEVGMPVLRRPSIRARPKPQHDCGLVA